MQYSSIFCEILGLNDLSDYEYDRYIHKDDIVNLSTKKASAYMVVERLADSYGKPLEINISQLCDLRNMDGIDGLTNEEFLKLIDWGEEFSVPVAGEVIVPNMFSALKEDLKIENCSAYYYVHWLTKSGILRPMKEIIRDAIDKCYNKPFRLINCEYVFRYIRDLNVETLSTYRKREDVKNDPVKLIPNLENCINYSTKQILHSIQEERHKYVLDIRDEVETIKRRFELLEEFVEEQFGVYSQSKTEGESATINKQVENIRDEMLQFFTQHIEELTHSQKIQNKISSRIINKLDQIRVGHKKWEDTENDILFLTEILTSTENN